MQVVVLVRCVFDVQLVRHAHEDDAVGEGGGWKGGGVHAWPVSSTVDET